MSKVVFKDQKQNFECDPQDNLKRRPIHKKTQKCEGLNNSPKLYPELSDEDEFDDLSEEQQNELNHTDEILNKAKRSQKRNDEVQFERKKLSSKASTSSYNYLSYFKYFIILMVMLIASLLSCFSGFRKPVEKLSLNEKLDNMRNLFHDQHHLNFLKLEKSLKKVVNVTREPSAPAIFTMSVNKNAIYKAHEFSHYLANTLAPESTVFINETISWHNNPNDIKLKIDDEIKSKAINTDLFVVVVDNLQNIPLKGAMIFHSYCDHEAAPFKQAVFLFIVPLNEILPKNTPSKKIDAVVFQQLKNIWNTASPDEIDSLITRITVNVINIS